MKIKFSKFQSSLHNEQGLNKSTKAFISGVEGALKSKLIYTKDLSDYQCDLKLIYIETGGSENLFIKNFKKLRAPYILITSGENNSLAASLEILHYLNLHRLKGEILHGDYQYIASRIKALCKQKK